MQKVKVALIGPGKWGKNVLSVLSDTTEVVCIVHQKSDVTGNYLKEHYPSIKHSNTVEDILNDNKIEAVFITTPIATHVELVKKALSANKHVFVEKPLTAKTEEAVELHNLADKIGRTLFIGYISVYHPIGQFLIEKVHNLKSASLYLHREKFGTFETSIIENFLVHDVALSKAILGDIQNIQEGNNTKDIAHFTLSHEKGSSYIGINRLSPAKNKTVVMNTQDEIFVWQNNSLFEFKDQYLKEIVLDSQYSSPLETEIQTFLSCLKKDENRNFRRDIDIAVATVLEELS